MRCATASEENEELNPRSYPAFREWPDRSQLFESLAAIPSVNWELTLAGHDEATVIEVSAVSGVFFQLLGIAAALGRTLLPEDDQPGAAVVVLSHALWARPLRRRPARHRPVPGPGRAALPIVGVMPAGVVYPKVAYLWISLPACEGGHFEDFGIWWPIAIGRLKTDATMEAATAELRAVVAILSALAPMVLERRAALDMVRRAPFRVQGS